VCVCVFVCVCACQRIVAERDVIVEFRLYMAYAWRMYCLNSGTMAGVTAMWLFVLEAFRIIGILVDEKLLHINMKAFSGILVWSLYFYFPVALIVFPIIGSFYLAVHRALSHDQALLVASCFGCFRSFQRYKQAVAMGSCIYVGCAVTWWALILPCLAFLTLSMFALPIYLEHPDLGIYKSFRYSFQLVWKYASVLPVAYMSFFLMSLLFYLWYSFRALCLVTIPVGYISLILCYHHLIGINGVRREMFFDDDPIIQDIEFGANVQPISLPADQSQSQSRNEAAAARSSDRNGSSSDSKQRDDADSRIAGGQ